MKQLEELKSRVFKLEHERDLLDHMLKEVGFDGGISTLKLSIKEIAEMQAKELDQPSQLR